MDRIKSHLYAGSLLGVAALAFAGFIGVLVKVWGPTLWPARKIELAGAWRPAEIGSPRQSSGVVRDAASPVDRRMEVSLAALGAASMDKARVLSAAESNGVWVVMVSRRVAGADEACTFEYKWARSNGVGEPILGKSECRSVEDAWAPRNRAAPKFSQRAGSLGESP